MAARELERNMIKEAEYTHDDSEISAEELWAEIDQKARRDLGMSGEQFAIQYRRGLLEDSFTVAELGFLLRCIDDTSIPA